MSDRYLDFANSTLGRRVASTLGLPRPIPLRREPGRGARTAILGNAGGGPAGAGVSARRRDCRGRFRPWRRGAADGPCLCRAADARQDRLRLQHFDFYELHEAFAAQLLCTLAAWEDPAFARDRLGRADPPGAIDRTRLNVAGSSLAAGHPFAATGGRILAHLATMIDGRGGGRGLISICAAGGQGVVGVVEK